MTSDKNISIRIAKGSRKYKIKCDEIHNNASATGTSFFLLSEFVLIIKHKVKWNISNKNNPK